MAFPVDVDGTWVNSGASYDAGELRRADAALFASAGIANGLTVTVDGSDVVTVQPGNAVISGEDAVVGTGVYRAGIGSAVTGSLAARNATNARIDLVVFRQLDTDVVGSHAARTSRIEIIAGAPSATPAVPTRPSMAVELARITVPASGGGTASVDASFRPYAVAAGGIATIPTAGSLPATGLKYQRVRALDTGVIHVYNGTQWLGADWTTLTVASPFVASSVPPRYKVTDGIIYFDGAVGRASSFSTSYTTAATIPAVYAPTQTRPVPASTNSTLAVAVQVTTAGAIQIYQEGATGSVMSIAALGSYPVI